MRNVSRRWGKGGWLLLGWVWLAAVPARAEVPPVSCPTVDACIARLVKASPGWEEGTEGFERVEAVTKALYRHGPDALPALIPLLQHPQRPVREAAAFALGWYREQARPALPALIEAVKRDPDASWATYALGHTRDPSVIPLLKELLLRGEGAATVALREFGESVLPFFVEVLETGSVEAVSALRTADDNFGPRGAAFVPRMARVAADPSRPERIRTTAVLLLEQMGPVATPALPVLRQLLEAPQGQGPSRDVLLRTLAKLGDASVVGHYQRQLDSPDRYERVRGFMALESLGPLAEPAVPRLVQVLRGDSDGYEQRWAVEVLGWTRSPAAVAPLLEALQSPSWRVQWEAAAALGRLGAREALPALGQLSQEHWFGPVRRVASQARDAIEHPAPGARPPHDSRKPFETRSRERLAREVAPEQRCSDERQRQWRVRKAQRWLTLKAPGRASRTKPPEGFPAVPLPEEGVASFLRVPEGWLVGVDADLREGELWLVTADGRKTVLARERAIVGFAQTPGGLKAFTGFADVLDDEGAVYALTREEGGGWRMRLLAELPGRPQVWKVDTDGALVVATRNGVMELSATGAQRLLTCP